MPGTADYLVIGACAAVVTFVLTPLVGRLARRYGWMAAPDERRVHLSATPDVGGLAMVAGFIAAIGLAAVLTPFDVLFARSSELVGVVIAGLLMAAVGFIDDVRDLSGPAKITGTVAAALVLVWFGVTMFYFRVPFLDVFYLSDDWIPAVTVLWLVGMTTAVNLIDGLDGLAAGIVAIAAGSFFLYSRRLDELDLLTQPNVGPLIAIITFGVCLGFLPHNFNPARIFMGDTGALFLGLLMAVSTSVVGGRADPDTQEFVGQTFFFLAPLFIPLLILGVPIIDVVFAIIRRARNRQGVLTADKGHLHHRLIALGHGQRRAVLILWLWTALLSGFVLYPVYTDTGTTMLVFALAALGLALYTVLHPEVVGRRRSDTPESGSD
jgi:UDP-GlcNAc:undecaprenyl-phosphate/decaprenyl-phosphate GlcNAc-1-phosphate transferase